MKNQGGYGRQLGNGVLAGLITWVVFAVAGKLTHVFPHLDLQVAGSLSFFAVGVGLITIGLGIGKVGTLTLGHNDIVDMQQQVLNLRLEAVEAALHDRFGEDWAFANVDTSKDVLKLLQRSQEFAQRYPRRHASARG